MSERDRMPRWIFWLGVSVGAAWLLYALRGVLAPVFFAFLIAYMLDPLVDRIETSRLLRNKPIARAVGIAVLLLGVFAVAARRGARAHRHRERRVLRREQLGRVQLEAAPRV